MMHREVVRRRRWIGEQQFLDHMAMTNLIPGPNSTELAMIIGREKAGPMGLLLAGVSFILPAAIIVGVVAWGYVTYGDTPAGDSLLYGIKPVVIAIIGQALFSLSRKALTTPLPASIGVVAFASYLAGINELVVLFGGAAAIFFIRVGRGHLAALVPAAVYGASATVTADVALDRLFLIFLKIGAVLYGSGYVLLAFMRGDLVDRLGWLTEEQLLDAVSIGQFTPGPLFTTATFVGYILDGIPGAIVASAGIFLPSFAFAAAVGHLGPRLRARRSTAALLDGVNASALGLMAGVTWQLATAAVVDPPTAAIAIAAMAVLVRFDLNSAWLVGGGAVAGMALRGLA